MGSEKTVGFLSQLTSAEYRALESCGRRRKYSRGEILFHEEDPPDEVLVLLSGRVKVSSTTEKGKEILLSVTGPGDLLGEISVLDGEPRSASATAIEAVDALAVSADSFRQFLQANPRVAILIVQTVGQRLRAADRQRVEFFAFDSVERVAGLLVELAERFGEPTQTGIRISLPLSQNEIAGWIGASREAVNKALQTLRAPGLSSPPTGGGSPCWISRPSGAGSLSTKSHPHRRIRLGPQSVDGGPSCPILWRFAKDFSIREVHLYLYLGP